MRKIEIIYEPKQETEQRNGLFVVEYEKPCVMLVDGIRREIESSI